MSLFAAELLRGGSLGELLGERTRSESLLRAGRLACGEIQGELCHLHILLVDSDFGATSDDSRASLGSLSQRHKVVLSVFFGVFGRETRRTRGLRGLCPAEDLIRPVRLCSQLLQLSLEQQQEEDSFF